ncbi:20722_t:CDS:2 [Entrophospora sp. SA101]|nr:20719_t:CDS:2 [Entrophospora sp. SA101]CAJ0832852.1 20722_t:CDS:2 [Entrophospora sp. SA101]
MSFENADFTQILDDLSSRFIINVPEEELSSIERICFQIEQAHWFYEDFVREQNSSLPSFTLKGFSARYILFLSKYLNEHEKAFGDFMQYKIRVPVCGAIMLNLTMDKVLLVKGWSSRSGWGFPKGKINKDELDSICAVREVFEETGYDITPLIKENDFVEITIRGQRIRLYIVAGVLEGANFCPQTRKEISKIEWHNLSDLPTWTKNRNKESPYNCGGGCVKYGSSRYYMVVPFVTNKKSYWLDDNNYAIKPSHESAIICSESDGIEEDEEDENLAFIDDHGHNIEDENSIFDHTTFIYHNINSNNGNSNNYKNNSSDNFVDNKKGKAKADLNYTKNTRSNHATSTTTTTITAPNNNKTFVPSIFNNLETQRKNSLLNILQSTKSMESSSSSLATFNNIEYNNNNNDNNNTSNNIPLYNNILQYPNTNNFNASNNLNSTNQQHRHHQLSLESSSFYNNNNSTNNYHNNNNYNKNNDNRLLNLMTTSQSVQGTSANNALYEEIRAQERQLLEWITTQI